MLKIENFSKIYPNNKGAKNISIEVKSGDIFAFIGHNGAGKSTTIKSIVGVNDIPQGDIFINGISMKNEPLKAKQFIAYVPDNPDIYESLTGQQFLEFVGNIYKVKISKLNELIPYYSKLLEIYDELCMPIGTYSHGMKQKLAIVSALIHSPSLLVLDEPFVGLDPKASYVVKQIMKDFVKNGGAIFFSTHVLEVAEKLCNKVAIIKNGEIIKQGNMDDIKKDKSLETVFLESENE